jgi:hypothetical protein
MYTYEEGNYSMTASYPHMAKINELAAQLEKELRDYESNIHREISYAAYSEIGTETQYWLNRGYDTDGARDKAADELERYHFENGHETPFDDELKTIQEVLTVLAKLKIADES